MSAAFRIVPTLYDKDGHPYCQSVMSPKENTVRAKCILPPDKVIPVIFVPGIMGSNLGTRNTKANKAGVAWHPDNKLWAWEFKGLLANQRQVILDPAQTYAASLSEIPDGESPFFAQAPKAAQKNWKAEYQRRGWGTVMLSSYGPLLYHLEFQLNRIYQTGTIAQPWRDLLQSQGKQWGEMQGYSKLEESELFKAGDYWYPVHAVGYNWLQSNGEAGKYLAGQINAFTAHYRKLGYPCEKVILVTHSMGGLVARATKFLGSCMGCNRQPAPPRPISACARDLNHR